MEDRNDGQWEKEEFEDLVTRALIATYETEMYQTKPAKVDGIRWTLPKHRRATGADLFHMRQIGPFFPPNDRIIMDSGEFWHDIDGIPDGGVLSFRSERQGRDALSGYLEIHAMKKIKAFPRGCVVMPGNYVAKYRVTSFYPQERGGMEAYSFHGGLREDGRFACEMDAEKMMPTLMSSVLQFYTDKRHMWNVRAIEGQAKATFGVYPSQIQSLFYARDLPMSETGRKRPILHWVKSHRRRIKKGTEVDIEKHLRGITEFEMGGTVFEITSPTKNVSH